MKIYVTFFKNWRPIGRKILFSALVLAVLGGCTHSRRPSTLSAVPRVIKQRPKAQAKKATTQASLPAKKVNAASALGKSPARDIKPVLSGAKVVHSVVTSQKVFALTFDDGPDPTYTPQVLAFLRAQNVPATFFMVGSMVRAHPQTALRVVEAGQTIGNHSWSHFKNPKSPVAEVGRTDAILKRVLGVATMMFRPPYGLLGNGMAAASQKEGEKVILWSAVGADWDKKATAATIAARILKKAAPGGIALLHDGGGNRTQTLAALPLIVTALTKKGYRFVSVPELLTFGPPTRSPVAKPHAKPHQTKRIAPVKRSAGKLPLAWKPLPNASPRAGKKQ